MRSASSRTEASTMGEQDQDIDLQQILEMYQAQTNKTSMNGRGLQVKGKFLSDHARSRADTLKAEFRASMLVFQPEVLIFHVATCRSPMDGLRSEQSRDEMNRARISEAPLNLSNLARLSGERNQKHIQRILDMYDSTYAGVSENRLFLVQEVDNDGTFPWTIPVMAMITLLCSEENVHGTWESMETIGNASTGDNRGTNCGTQGSDRH
ncbi:hypothetical protein BS47DRAFT_519561 [Hydnum rufescens UP504]|uniref:Uncharacterized protein n=1 Tax=Hydnum rufescens UP504 TaxID=1448309 RepID=A0A9P6AGZ8_9AGAM|nr:hypothetical protein BS47DRAFT_519561 [Hydnum rufescens UP504]